MRLRNFRHPSKYCRDCRPGNYSLSATVGYSRAAKLCVGLPAQLQIKNLDKCSAGDTIAGQVNTGTVENMNKSCFLFHYTPRPSRHALIRGECHSSKAGRRWK